MARLGLGQDPALQVQEEFTGCRILGIPGRGQDDREPDLRTTAQGLRANPGFGPSGLGKLRSVLARQPDARSQVIQVDLAVHQSPHPWMILAATLGRIKRSTLASRHSSRWIARKNGQIWVR